MALSDDMRKLSERAKTAEDHAAAARTQAKADLEQSVDKVRASAESEGHKLQTEAKTTGAQMASSWDDVQQSWNAHLAKVRKDVDQRKASFDARTASDRANSADADAALAIHYAYAAIEEAEYAVLDAVLAHRQADEAVMAASR